MTTTAIRTTTCIAVDHNEVDCRAANVAPSKRCEPCKRADKRAEDRNMVDAHVEGLHVEFAREFCPECEAEGRRR